MKAAILKNGDISAISKKLIASGKTQKDVEETSRKYIKEFFVSGQISNNEAVSYLKKYGAQDSQGAIDKVTYWKWQQENPDSPLSESAALKYNRNLQSYNIKLDVWEDVWKYSNGNGKEDVLYYIHSQKLSVTQKDALYYACDYAASKLKEAPWHSGK